MAYVVVVWLFPPELAMRDDDDGLWEIFWVLFRIIILLFPVGFPVLQYPFISPNPIPSLPSISLSLSLIGTYPRCHKHSNVECTNLTYLYPRFVFFFVSQNLFLSLAWFGTGTNTHNTVLFRHYIAGEQKWFNGNCRTNIHPALAWCVEIYDSCDVYLVTFRQRPQRLYLVSET